MAGEEIAGGRSCGTYGLRRARRRRGRAADAALPDQAELAQAERVPGPRGELAAVQTSGCWSSPGIRDLPLLERVRFVSIFASELDEFFGVRVAGRTRRMATGLAVETASGQSAGGGAAADPGEWHGSYAGRHAVCYPRILPALGRGPGRDPALEGLPPAGKEGSTACSGSGSTRCSPRSSSIPPTRSPISPACRSASRWWSRDSVTGGDAVRPGQGPPLLPRFLSVAPNRFVPLEDVIAAHLGGAVRRAWTCSSTTPSG